MVWETCWGGGILTTIPLWIHSQIFELLLRTIHSDVVTGALEPVLALDSLKSQH
jgi:hypothetical protein